MTQDDGHIPNTIEKQIFETMVKIRERDSSIYDSNKHFFAESADPDKPGYTGPAAESRKASKPMMLKDVIAQQVQTVEIHRGQNSPLVALCATLYALHDLKSLLYGHAYFCIVNIDELPYLSLLCFCLYVMQVATCMQQDATCMPFDSTPYIW